jgi:hypothetical protein
LPRGGKPIKGASVRLAEIIAQQWGNNRVDARVVSTDRVNKTITAEGFFHDLEKNSATKRSITRRISDRRGRLFSEDMIVVTGNAACAIALRNAILGGVPKAVWRKAYEAAERVIAGDIKTLVVRREAAIKAFAAFGVKPEQIFAALGVAGTDDIGLDHIPVLAGMYSALKSGEETVEEMFNPRRIGGSGGEAISNPLAESVDDLGVKPLPAEKVSASEPKDESSTDQERKFVDPIKDAEARGFAMHREGFSRKAVPPEFRAPDKTALSNAWVRGWDTADKQHSAAQS